jgi:hypothetical protein
MNALILIDELIQALNAVTSQKALSFSQEGANSIRIASLNDDSEPAVIVTFALDGTLLNYLGNTFVKASCVALKRDSLDVEDFFSDPDLSLLLVTALLELYEPEFVQRIYKADIQSLISETEIQSKTLKNHPFYEKIYEAVQTIHLDFIQGGKNYGLIGPTYDQLSNKQL